jgi:plastocyanin
MNKLLLTSLFLIIILAGCTQEQIKTTGNESSNLNNSSSNVTSQEVSNITVASISEIRNDSISIINAKIVPSKINVKLGDNVEWTNNDETSYTIRQENNIIYNKNITSGEHYIFNYINLGNFTYYLKEFPDSRLTVIVTE